jgi:hypothetical protein
MQVELKVNDKSVRVEMTEEQLKKLGLIEDKPKTGYERVDEDESYFVDDTINDGHEVLGGRTLVNNLYYINGNYYNDKSIVENNAHADRLLRRLRQWQASHDKAITLTDWEANTNKYKIKYNYVDNCPFVCIERNLRDPNIVYFSSNKKAEDAIEQFADELLWYFTEYVQRLDEVQNV